MITSTRSLWAEFTPELLDARHAHEVAADATRPALYRARSGASQLVALPMHRGQAPEVNELGRYRAGEMVVLEKDFPLSPVGGAHT